MKIGVISDTHGQTDAIQRAVRAVGPVNMWLHAGDFGRDGQYLSDISGLPVAFVAGNCDGGTEIPPDRFLDISGKKIWLTHGHRHRVKFGIHELTWWVRQYEMDIVVYGHTHIPDITWQDGLLIFNPGSAAFTREGGQPTCGFLEITAEGVVKPRIVAISVD